MIGGEALCLSGIWDAINAFFRRLIGSLIFLTVAARLLMLCGFFSFLFCQRRSDLFHRPRFSGVSGDTLLVRGISWLTSRGLGFLVLISLSLEYFQIRADGSESADKPGDSGYDCHQS